MFLLNSCLSLFSAACFQAPLLPKLRGHFAEFLNNASSAGLRILSSSTCVGLRYGYSTNNSGFSRRMAHVLRYYISLRITSLSLESGFSNSQTPPLAPVLPFPAPLPLPCPRSSDIRGCRNLNLLSIGYAVKPLLRPRLTQGRSALPWKPWIFGRKDSHLALATHSGILSSMQSTASSDTASSRMQCSSTNLSVPRLRCGVSAPDIFGAGPLDQ